MSVYLILFKPCVFYPCKQVPHSQSEVGKSLKPVTNKSHTKLASCSSDYKRRGSLSKVCKR